MGDNSQNDSLEELERRWADERSPQVALHLAEEHRKRGDAKRALEILRSGLEHHPGHMAARVALGRVLLEDSQTGEAIELLESVVAEDPSHLVANKLLIKTHLEQGDLEHAADRLELYKVLNPSDADIETLEAKLPEMQVDELEVVADGDETAEVRDEVAKVAAQGHEPEARSDPFSDLWERPAGEEYETALLAEGLFQLGASDVSAPAGAEVETLSSEGADATATLGRLYLEQGHVEEAEKIFQSLLEQQPTGKAGSQQADEAPAASGGRLTADQLVDPVILDAAGPAECKRLVLESYRLRLRAASAGGE